VGVGIQGWKSQRQFTPLTRSFQAIICNKHILLIRMTIALVAWCLYAYKVYDLQSRKKIQLKEVGVPLFFAAG